MDGPEAFTDELARLQKRRWREAAFVATLAITLNLVGNGRISLWDRDEPRYAGCTREMRDRGDWLFPTFNGEPRYHKPVLIYWLMRGGFAIGGDNPFGARLVSAFAGMATSLIVLRLGRRMFGDHVGLLGAIMLTTAPIMVIESKLATTDATLALFLVGAQSCLWELSGTPSRRYAALFWTLMALATLTKGPVGLAMVATSGAASWWFCGPRTAWGRLNWAWGVPLFLLITAPWYVAVGVLSQGEFFRFALGKQVAERVMSGVEQHGGFPGYYLVSSLLLFHPWSALLPAALVAAWGKRKARPEFGFLLGWVVGPWVMLECVRTKLVHYYLPSYPACALLASWLTLELVREGARLRDRTMGRVGLYLLGGVGMVLVGVFLVGAILLPSDLRLACVAIALAIATGTILGVVLWQGARGHRAVLGLATTWGLVLLLLSGWLLPAAEPYRSSRVVGERLAWLADEHKAAPLLLSFQEPTLVWTMKRSAPMIRTWARFYEELDRNGTIVTAIIPLEFPEFQRRRDHLDVDIREVVTGFDLNKGQRRTVRLALIRRISPVLSPESSRRETVAAQDLGVE